MYYSIGYPKKDCILHVINKHNILNNLLFSSKFSCILNFMYIHAFKLFCIAEPLLDISKNLGTAPSKDSASAQSDQSFLALKG